MPDGDRRDGPDAEPIDGSEDVEGFAAPAFVLLSTLLIVLPGMTLAAGRVGGAGWLVHISIGLAIGFGFLAGLVFPTVRKTEGAMVPYVLFLAASVFAAVEAHAVGLGIARGAPAVAAALVVPPLAIAAGSLWMVARRTHGVGGTARGEPHRTREA